MESGKRVIVAWSVIKATIFLIRRWAMEFILGTTAGATEEISKTITGTVMVSYLTAKT